ncbi:DUF5666 domain-containing protein [Colwellia psychrerythraea]|uniref:DUF5666 domain-containing protein n=1 Tax=Colwellia psychrerythraea TaxID=28229 RepID=A0A099KIP2_COLPS|nr:DUF5666 domain-containing protein [Colwellia psychrerythraea]KGJ90664.1 hypothetical protein GAB14E_3470 [Colwellia psychrerythraea]
MRHLYKSIAVIAIASLVLTGCGSDDEEPVSHVTSSGVISGFGSVYVNGVRYTTKDSYIIANGRKSDEAALKVGMKVVVAAKKSSTDDPSALEVTYLADAVGAIDAIDLTTRSLTILGQTYLITEATNLDNALFSELTVGSFIELSAFENEYGNFVVSYLEIKEQQAEHQLTGTISNINKVNKTFTIGQLLVSYVDADITGQLNAGSLVQIKSKFFPINNEFIADEVTAQGLTLFIDGTLEVTGIVEDMDKAEETTIIKLSGRKYVLTDSSDFTQGDDDDLQIGRQISLVATVIEQESTTPIYPINSIRVELENEISLEGIVESVTDTSFTLFGQEFTVDEYTQYKDESEQALRYFNFTDIAIGDKLDIDAYEVDSVLISRKVEREETGGIEQDSYDIEGVVDSFALPSFSVKGITILTNGQTKFEDAHGNTVNQGDFFLTITKGDEVETEITFTENGWLALEVEIEGEDNDVELLGTIDTFTSVINFMVNSHQVTTNLQTEFENGNASNLSKGVLIEVEGTINSKGELVAEEIEFIETEAN